MAWSGHSIVLFGRDTICELARQGLLMTSAEVKKIGEAGVLEQLEGYHVLPFNLFRPHTI